MRPEGLGKLNTVLMSIRNKADMTGSCLTRMESNVGYLNELRRQSNITGTTVCYTSIWPERCSSM
jgi:hypothetical protein